MGIASYINNGTFRELSKLDRFDASFGIISNEFVSSKYKAEIKSIANYASGAYSDAFALDIAKKILNGTGITPMAVSRDNGVATISISVKSGYDEFETTITITSRGINGEYSN